jgi:hypothetical protein
VVGDVADQLERIARFMEHLDATAAGDPAGAVAETPDIDDRPGSSAEDGVSARRRKAFHQRTLRTVRVKHPRPAFPAAQPVDDDPRSKQEIEELVRFIAGSPVPEKPLAQRTIAHLARTSPATVNRVLRRRQNPAPPPHPGVSAQHVNGSQPELETTR